ncbi:G2 and S phase-expressed protein 1-like [Urocitellus parryii]
MLQEPRDAEASGMPGHAKGECVGKATLLPRCRPPRLPEPGLPCPSQAPRSLSEIGGGNWRSADFRAGVSAPRAAKPARGGVRVRARLTSGARTSTPRVHRAASLFKPTNRRLAPPGAAFKPSAGRLRFPRPARVKRGPGEGEVRGPVTLFTAALSPQAPPGKPRWTRSGRKVSAARRFRALGGRRVAPPQLPVKQRPRPPRTPPGPQRRRHSGILLADEKFDFDLSLSSSSANEDDEVFFGPVGHRERCIAASLELNHQIAQQPRLPASDGPCTLSPLPAEKFVEVYREARLLALQLESHSREEGLPAAGAGSSWSQGVEKFIQESKLKMKLFEKEEEMEKSPKSLKRETYYLSDSPFPGLPPSGEPLLPASSLALPSTPARVGPVLTQGLPSSSCPLPGEPGAVCPPDQGVPPKRVASKLQLPRASSVRGRPLPSALEKPKTERPASPSRVKLLNEKQPHRDVLLDKPSLALDAVSLPAHGSYLGQGKRSLPIPSKVGLKKTLLKPPGYTGSLTRKSSSSGSVSSRTSSVCASPGAGKGEQPAAHAQTH